MKTLSLHHPPTERGITTLDEAIGGEMPPGRPPLSRRRRQILRSIDKHTRQRGYPPSIREIGNEVGLTSPSTVHAHLKALEADGYLERDAAKPRAVVINLDPSSGAALNVRGAVHVPLIGEVAAGSSAVADIAEWATEEVLALPERFTGPGRLFMVKVRGDSMIDAGILADDYVVVKRQQDAKSGEIVVVGTPDGDALVKIFKRRGGKVVLLSANALDAEMVLEPVDVRIYGRVVTVVRPL